MRDGASLHAHERHAIEAALAIWQARQMHGPAKRFAYELRTALGWSSLTRQAVYLWERGDSRVPAEALLAAARLTGLTVDELIADAQRFAAVRAIDDPSSCQAQLYQALTGSGFRA